MAIRFLNKKTQRFRFQTEDGDDASYVLIFGDEVDAPANATGNDPEAVTYRGRDGTWTRPALTRNRSTEMYFLDVEQGDAAFIVTPNNTKILVDGGLRELALGFLIWKYRLDQDGNQVTIDHLVLSHADKDHVQGLIPLLRHPGIRVLNIYHNGIGLFDSGFNTPIGRRAGGRLHTLHSSTDDLVGLDLASGSQAVFADWIAEVHASGATYQRLDSTVGVLNVGDPDIDVEIVGPILEPDGTLVWLGTKSKTINGHSLTFRFIHGAVRVFFSGDLNERGSRHLLDAPNGALRLNAHVLKAPHHGSHDFDEDLLAAVNPMITVVSSGEIPDHGHPRASFLAAIGCASRGEAPLLFSTELAALFVDVHDAEATAGSGIADGLGDLDFDNDGNASAEARRRFKKVLPGIINVRTDGSVLYAFRRVQQSYGWESYGPITPTL